MIVEYAVYCTVLHSMNIHIRHIYLYHRLTDLTLPKPLHRLRRVHPRVPTRRV